MSLKKNQRKRKNRAERSTLTLHSATNHDEVGVEAGGVADVDVVILKVDAAVVVDVIVILMAHGVEDAVVASDSHVDVVVKEAVDARKPSPILRMSGNSHPSPKLNGLAYAQMKQNILFSWSPAVLLR